MLCSKDARGNHEPLRLLKRSAPSVKICPQCGELIEMFSIDTQMTCEKCGFIAYNDTLSCVQWCAFARKCVGDEMYEHMMEITAAQKAQK